MDLFLLFSIILILLLGYLIYTDYRFSFNRKIFFLFGLILIIIISIFIEKVPLLIIKDLFGYTLILNISFIFHVLIMDRLFRGCVDKKYEYLGFIVSRISLMLSIGNLLYLIKKYGGRLTFFLGNIGLDFFRFRHINSFEELENEKYEYEYLKFFSEYKYRKFVYSHKSILFIFRIIDTVCEFLQNTIFTLQYTIMSILIYFSIVFHKYSRILLGIDQVTRDGKLLLKMGLIFIIFFIISLIVGIPRLYMVGIFMGLGEFGNIINCKYSLNSKREAYEKADLLGKLNHIFIKSGVGTLFSGYYDDKFRQLNKIRHYIYHEFFTLHFDQFISGKTYMFYTYIVPYKFYPGKQIAVQCCKEEIVANEEEGYTYSTQEKGDFIMKWAILLNREAEFIDELCLELFDMTPEQLLEKE